MTPFGSSKSLHKIAMIVAVNTHGRTYMARKIDFVIRAEYLCIQKHRE